MKLEMKLCYVAISDRCMAVGQLYYEGKDGWM